MPWSQWRSILCSLIVFLTLVGTFLVLALVIMPSAGAAGGCGGG
jgi:hypothetical protein